MNRNRTYVIVAAVWLCIASGLARATPEVGWWWNPAESGRGFFVESQNGYIYFAAYFYDNDGRAQWLVAGGENADPNFYRGRLLAYADGQTLFGGYKAPGAPTDAGEVTLQFVDDTHGSVTWPGGTIPIERQIFGTGATAFAPDNGWWWSPAESGRGYSVEVQGDKLFVVSFMYDDLGRPVWYFSAGPMTSPTSYSGAWLRFADGQTLTGPYRPPSTPIAVGNLSIEFTGANRATMTFEDLPAASGAPVPKAGRGPKTIQVQREFPAKPKDLPSAWKGSMSSTYLFAYEEGPVSERVEITYRVDDVVWMLDEGITPLIPDNGPWAAYQPAQGTVAVTFSEWTVDLSTGSVCETPATTWKFPISASDGNLYANGYSQYKGTFVKELSWETNFRCTFRAPDGKTHVENFPKQWTDMPFEIIRFEGVITKSPVAITDQSEWLMFPTLPGVRKKTAKWYLEAVK